MLLRPDATFIDQATKRAERVFPRGTGWRTFESKFPAADVFKNSVLDPAIGITGELALRTFATADWQNWVSSMQIGLFEVATRIGLPPLEDKSLQQGLSLVFDSLGETINAFQESDNPAEIIPEIVKNVGLQVLQQIAGMTGIIGQTVAQVITAAVWAVGVVRSQVESDLAKNIALPPLQSEDPATDTWQVNRVFEVFRQRGSGGVVYPDGKVEPASNADYTGLYLPAYNTNQPWRVQYREKGVAAQQGYPTTGLGPNGDTEYRFDIRDGSSFGFMPGTTTMLRVLQTSYRFYYSVRGTPVDRYTLRCRGVKKTCWKSVKTFNGDRDCRQCVDAESVWPVQGLGWAYGGVPLNATTPGENVGAFYPSTNKLLGNLLDAITQPGPLLYTLNVERINREWKRCFENFWEFAAGEWRRYNGTGWRGMIARLATLMATFEWDDQIHLGGRHMHMPMKAINSPREAEFRVKFSESIYKRLIEPFCRDLYNLQGYYLDTFNVAYIPPGAGAIYDSYGRIRKTQIGDYFLTARRELLNSNKRVLVDLRQVADPEYRAELQAAGVKASPVNQALFGSPGVSGHELLKPTIKPRRVPRKPKRMSAPPLEGAAQLVQVARFVGVGPQKERPVLRARPVEAGATDDAQGQGTGPSRSGVALGVAAGGAALTAAAIVGLSKMTKE